MTSNNRRLLLGMLLLSCLVVGHSVAQNSGNSASDFQGGGILRSPRLWHSVQPPAQAHRERANKQVHYRVIDLGALGGSASNGFGSPSNRGWVTGDANLPGDLTEHGFLWRDGVMTDLGTLGGLNSSVSFPVKDDRGLITGVAQTETVDPLGEFWGTSLICGTAAQPVICQGFQNLERGFVWQDGVMTELRTLGGNNGAALGVNDRGQVVGVAELMSCSPSSIILLRGRFTRTLWIPPVGIIPFSATEFESNGRKKLYRDLSRDRRSRTRDVSRQKQCSTGALVGHRSSA
jgi:probable HAF family extracellular repeat protein